MSKTQSVPTIAVEACAKMLEVSAKACQPVAAKAESASGPNWDAMATSLSSLSTAFAFGSVLLGLIALVAAFGWGYVVTVRAEREARKEAKACAREMIDRWLVEEAPLIVRRKLEMLQDTSMGTEDDDHAADEMGRAAG